MLRVFPMIGAAAVILTGPALAEVNVEYGQEYEEAYLLMCERDNSHRACSCAMATLQEKIGFQRFAEEIERHRNAFFERSPMATLATDLVNACSAVAGETKEE
jgi:hypothetical protein